MPGFDGTGPQGGGAMTGGGRGVCNSNGASYGRGFSGGFAGRGAGMRRGFRAGASGYNPGRPFARTSPYSQMANTGPYATYAMSRDEEINWLKDEADAVNKELNSINKRLQELAKEDS